jgi:hypothetical protein
MTTRIAFMTLAMCVCLAPRSEAQTTQPAPAEPGAPLQQQAAPPDPSLKTDNAPRGIQPDLSVAPIREQTHINNRTGRLTHSADGQQAIFNFDIDPDGSNYPPMTVMPNLKLLLLEGAVSPRNNDFAISGTVTEYKGKNYILLDNVPRGTIPERPTVTVVREGTHLTNRACRLSHTAAGQALLTFDADSKTQEDPPMIIQPNLKLQTMENMVTGLGKDVHFRISGMVTEFKGKNYILLDKAVVVPDVDQQM